MLILELPKRGTGLMFRHKQKVGLGDVRGDCVSSCDSEKNYATLKCSI